MAGLACERNPRICNRACSNAARYNNRRSVRLRCVAPSRFSPAESLAEQFRSRRRTVRRVPHSWPTNTERRVSSLERASFTQVCAGRNCKLAGTRSDNQFLVRDGLHRPHPVVRIRRVMFEVEIYARGLREMGNILELDRQLVEIAGLRYKMDTNHDIVHLEFDEPTLSIREIRAIFLKLGLEPLIIGAIPPELHSRTKTERLSG